MASVWGELKRRNVVKVAVAYAIVGWLLIEVSSTVLPLFEAPDWIAQVFAFFIILGFPVALVLSWAYELTSEGIKLERDVAAGESITHVTGRKIDFAIIGALVLALGVVLYTYVLKDDGGIVAVLPNSVAVLPFDNLSPNPDDAYFAAGLHDEILSQLAKLSNLSVISRTSVLRYADSDLSIPEIARELNVGTVMEGSVRYADDRVRITTQLIDAATDEHLWSETYEREFSDIFAIESDIAMNVANALEAEFSLEEQRSIEQIPTDSTAAYRLYLAALEEVAVSEIRLEYLTLAIEVDPTFALAYAQRARWYAIGFNTSLGALGAEDDYARRVGERETLATQDIDRALALDSTLAEAYASRAYIETRNWRGASARESYETGLRFSPNSSVLLSEYAAFSSSSGNHVMAIRLKRRSIELDPAQTGLGAILHASGDLQGAAAAYREEIDSSSARLLTRVILGSNFPIVLIQLGELAEAEERLREVEARVFRMGNGVMASEVAYAYMRLGLEADAKRIAEQVNRIAETARVSPANWVLLSIAREDESAALEWLMVVAEKAPHEGYQAVNRLKLNIWGDPVLEKPAFAELREQIGFTDL